MLKASLYHYPISWDEEERQFQGGCLEFPDVVWSGHNHDDVKSLLQSEVTQELNKLHDKGEPLPLPRGSDILAHISAEDVSLVEGYARHLGITVQEFLFVLIHDGVTKPDFEAWRKYVDCPCPSIPPDSRKST